MSLFLLIWLNIGNVSHLIPFKRILNCIACPGFCLQRELYLNLLIFWSGCVFSSVINRGLTLMLLWPEVYLCSFISNGMLIYLGWALDSYPVRKCFVWMQQKCLNIPVDCHYVRNLVFKVTFTLTFSNYITITR